MKKFISLSILLIISRLFDILTTYLYIPNLEGEFNPLVSIFKLGWLGALFVQFLGLFFLIYAVYVYCFKKVETISFDNKTSLKSFIAIFHFNNPNHFVKLFYKLPTNKNSLIYSLGAIVSKGLIIFSFLVGISTTLLILSEKYQSFYRLYKVPYILTFISLILMLLIAFFFYKKEREERLNFS